MRVPALIGVPFMCGDGAHPAGDGARRCLERLHELRASRQLPTTVPPVVSLRAGEAPSTPVAASLRVNQRLAGAVRDAIAGGRLPLVFAGSCDASLGVLAGLEDAGCGVVWLDAHADFNTPETSVSGFFPGMSLAVVTGHCHRGHWAQAGGNGPVPERSVVLMGVRDLSPAAERARLDRSAIRVVPWEHGRPRGDVIAALDALAERVRRVYVHVDLDALDPRVASGVVDDPVPGGLSVAQAEAIVRGVRERFRLQAAAITTYVPERDEDDRTLGVAVRLAGLLTEDG